MPTLTSKAQVTIPKRIRMVLGIKPGDEVDFNLKGKTIVLLKKKKSLPFEKWRGHLGRGKTDKLMEELR
ncbi:MAG TPA: AbrB/MazE/SpoVT family DNA-binding domain-containing protein [Candidatus Nanoarchaeia archaeon]|nr:AbrB/MazE/SpoVT family DNA-binding domain-containing protein [Candidatus Nanoarchaeia archaeon]